MLHAKHSEGLAVTSQRPDLPTFTRSLEALARRRPRRHRRVALLSLPMISSFLFRFAHPFSTDEIRAHLDALPTARRDRWDDAVYIVTDDAETLRLVTDARENDRDGMPWGIGFSGPANAPADPHRIEPWKWTAARLEELATGFEIEEQWNHDLEAVVTFGTKRFRATFALDLLQTWVPS